MDRPRIERSVSGNTRSVHAALRRWWGAHLTNAYVGKGAARGGECASGALVCTAMNMMKFWLKHKAGHLLGSEGQGVGMMPAVGLAEGPTG